MMSRIAVLAAAPFLFSVASLPANAADLGGGCCADLEERVAELEATTARKGNRVVSLQIYGQVNKSLLVWDDGIDSDAFIVDNDQSGGRVGFQGSASIKPGWSAGYNIEIGIQDAASDKVNQLSDDGNELDLDIRKNELYIESETFGRLTIGQGSSASDGSSEVVLGSSLSDSLVEPGAAFFVRSEDVAVNAAGLADSTNLDLGDFANNLDGAGRIDRVRYDTPSIYGFIVSASWGEDDIWDVALRFKKEWNSIRIAAAVAYLERSDDEGDAEQISGSISAMHVPTGIYGAFAAGQVEEDGDDAGDYWYAQLGLEKRFLPYGSTTIYGEYAQYNDFAVGEDVDGLVGGAIVDASEATLWGFGVNQKIDSAAMDIYAQVSFWEFDAGITGDEEISLEDQMFVMIGSRIKF